MAIPSISASFDQASYAKGETVTLTVAYSDPDTEALSITVSVTDKSGNTTGPVAVTAVIDPLEVEVSGGGGRVWTKVSDSGSVAVYQTTA